MNDLKTETPASLRRLGLAELRARYAELFGEGSTSANKPWLIRRILWRQQADAQGGLSERALARVAELAPKSDFRQTAPAPRSVATVALPRGDRDERLPPPGAVLTRNYKGRKLEVRVLAEGFECEGVVHATLSAAAKAISGSHCNGFRFFGLERGADR